MAKQSKVQQNKVKAGHRSKKGKACPACGRRMKRSATVCQFKGE
jgi:hypothetical protein